MGKRCYQQLDGDKKKPTAMIMFQLYQSKILHTYGQFTVFKELLSSEHLMFFCCTAHSLQSVTHVSVALLSAHRCLS